MAKRDLQRRIDLRPTGTGSNLPVVVASSTDPDPDDPQSPGRDPQVVYSKLYVGRREGPHVGLFRVGNEIFLQAVDTANVPFMGVGAIDYEPNSTWLRIGYADQPHIRLQLPTAGPQDTEQHRPIEIDAGAIVGALTADTASIEASEIGQVFFSLDGATFTAEVPLTDDGGWLVDETTGVLLVVD